MMFNTKLLLLLFGALLLLNSARGEEDEQLDPKERRKIIQSMLRSQKDIHRALLRIRQQIINDGQVPEGDDDVDEETYDDSSEESEEHHQAQQMEIREARERINSYVREIAENFEEIHQLIAKIDSKVAEELINAGKRKVSYNLHYRPERRPPSHGHSGESGEMPNGGPPGAPVVAGPAPVPPTMPSNTEVSTTSMSPTNAPPDQWLPTQPPMPENGAKNQVRRRKRPHHYRESRFLEALGAAEDAEPLQ